MNLLKLARNWELKMWVRIKLGSCKFIINFQVLMIPSRSKYIYDELWAPIKEIIEIRKKFA